MFSKQQKRRTIKECVESVEKSLKTNEKVQKLTKEISNRNPSVLKNGFNCQICGFDEVEGSYSRIDQRINLCANKLFSDEQTTKTLIHELVHAYVTK
jgi:methyl coenzyme M reductase alpha subunit